MTTLGKGKFADLLSKMSPEALDRVEARGLELEEQIVSDETAGRNVYHLMIQRRMLHALGDAFSVSYDTNEPVELPFRAEHIAELLYDCAEILDSEVVKLQHTLMKRHSND